MSENLNDPRISPDKIKTMIIVNLGGIGDLLLSTPALRALKEHFPETHISFLGVERTVKFARTLPYIDQVYALDVKWSPLVWLRNAATLFSLHMLRADLAINMRTLVSKVSAFKMRVLFNIIGAKVNAGRDTEKRGEFFDIRVPETGIGDKHEMEYDIDTVVRLGAIVSDRRIDFDISPAARKKIDHMCGTGHWSGDKIVGIHLGGKSSHQWSLASLIQFVKALSSPLRLRFILTGDSVDRLRSQQLMQATKIDMLDTCGRLDLEELGATIEKCSLYLTNDTGPMHIAAALKTPLLAIFGPGYLTRFDPRHISEKAIVFCSEVVCSPCNKDSCDSMECLSAIKPEAVASAAMGFLVPGQDK